MPVCRSRRGGRGVAALRLYARLPAGPAAHAPTSADGQCRCFFRATKLVAGLLQPGRCQQHRRVSAPSAAWTRPEFDLDGRV